MMCKANYELFQLMTILLIKSNDFYSCAKSRFILHILCFANTYEIDALVCIHMFCITSINMARRDRDAHAELHAN